MKYLFYYIPPAPNKMLTRQSKFQWRHNFLSSQKVQLIIYLMWRRLCNTMNYLIRRQSKRYIIIWFNSPFIKVVSTNVSKTFLQLLTKNFPRSRKLHKILNRNTVKVSCMNNMSKIIKGHNKKVTSKPHYQTLKYNCRKKCILGWQKENRRAVSVNTSYHLNITDILIRQHVHTYTYTDTCVYIYIYILYYR